MHFRDNMIDLKRKPVCNLGNPTVFATIGSSLAH
jgi:hypothetical protein